MNSSFPVLRTFLIAAAAVMLATPAAGQASAVPAGSRFTKADVEFMQGMIAHHAQAIVMSALVPSRTQSQPIRMLAKRIEVSQTDEIKLMQQWLADRHQEVPDPKAHSMHHDSMLMPGMLTQAQLDQLSAARGPEFDRLFLEDMTRHHEGALTMVAKLFATPGAGQEAATFSFASDVEADQRAEIGRMRALLDQSNEGHRP